MQRRIQSRIPPEQAGTPVLRFLVKRFSYHTQEEWLARVTSGRILVNDQATTPDRVLAAGDVVGYTADDIPEPRVNVDFTVVHDDADILVIDKPPNLPCHPGGRYFNHTLWAELKRRFKVEAPAFVNRLDRETSGLVVVAKHDRAARHCCNQFARRRVIKRYTALVEGSFPEALEARGNMEPDPGSGMHKRWVFRPASGPGEADPSGTWAATTFRSVSRHGGLSLIEALPDTGRHHQIRATLRALGFPVVGDKLYGPDPLMFVRFCTDALTEHDWQRLRMKRQALHAGRLEFRHPDGGRLLQFHAPIPEDMRHWMGESPPDGIRL
jgi:RluA family pseudouridine synthase